MPFDYGRRTALIVTDVQNDFADPGGSLYVRGGEQVVSVINREVVLARQVGALVVYTQDWHPPRTPHFASEGGVWPQHCIGESWGAELRADLLVEGEIVRKGANGEDGYSGFSVRDPLSGARDSTLLEELLREHGVGSVVIVGIATDYCVKETALDAALLRFETFVLREAVRSVDLRPGDGERALAELSGSGVTIL